MHISTSVYDSSYGDPFILGKTSIGSAILEESEQRFWFHIVAANTNQGYSSARFGVEMKKTDYACTVAFCIIEEVLV